MLLLSGEGEEEIDGSDCHDFLPREDEESLANDGKLLIQKHHLLHLVQKSGKKKDTF